MCHRISSKFLSRAFKVLHILLTRHLCYLSQRVHVGPNGLLFGLKNSYSFLPSFSSIAPFVENVVTWKISSSTSSMKSSPIPLMWKLFPFCRATGLSYSTYVSVSYHRDKPLRSSQGHSVLKDGNFYYLFLSLLTTSTVPSSPQEILVE